MDAAAVEALGNTLRVELRASGARVGVACFAEIDTDMTSRGFGTEAASKLVRPGWFSHDIPVSVAIDSVERGIARRSRRVVTPGWVAAVLPTRMLAQRAIDVVSQRGLQEALQTAREENAPLTTEQPD